MIIIDSLPTEIQVPKHTSETEGLTFSVFGAEGEVFTTDALKVDGLHYKVLIDGEIKEGAYRYQVEKEKHIIEVGILRYTTQKQRDVYETTNTDVIYYQ